MLQNQAFISLLSYYLGLLQEGAVLEVHYSDQTFAERWVYDAQTESYCIWESDTKRITEKLDTNKFFQRTYEKRPEMCELFVYREAVAA